MLIVIKSKDEPIKDPRGSGRVRLARTSFGLSMLKKKCPAVAIKTMKPAALFLALITSTLSWFFRTSLEPVETKAIVYFSNRFLSNFSSYKLCVPASIRTCPPIDWTSFSWGRANSNLGLWTLQVFTKDLLFTGHTLYHWATTSAQDLMLLI